MRVWPIAAFAFAFLASPAFADPAGSYIVSGFNPTDGATYTGTAIVQKTGDTYRVTWLVGRTRYDGTGIGNKDFLAVSYKSDNSAGIALYGPTAGGWKGVWTYAGGRTMGGETWTRK